MFLKEQNLVNQLIESNRLVMLKLPCYMLQQYDIECYTLYPNDTLEQELIWFGKFASGFKTFKTSASEAR